METSVPTQRIRCKFATRFALLLVGTLLLIIPNVLTALVIPLISNTQVSRYRILTTFRSPQYRMSKKDDSIENDENFDSDDEDDDDDYDLEPVFAAADVRGRPAGVVLEDLGWRVEKLRLEEANKRSFLKSGPRFLPYAEAKKWVQAWGERWISEEEWKEWISAGEKRNSYIPSRPDEYYTRTGNWISWEDFLGVEKKDDNETDSN